MSTTVASPEIGRDIDAGGIRVGEMLPDQEGLLGGRPTLKASATATAGTARHDVS